MTKTADRRCEKCKTRLVQRASERPSAFKARRYCSMFCSSTASGWRRKFKELPDKKGDRTG